MIAIGGMPCIICKHYKGIEQREQNNEASEYVRCEIARENDAKNLLEYKNTSIDCKKFIDIDEV